MWRGFQVLMSDGYKKLVIWLNMNCYIVQSFKPLTKQDKLCVLFQVSQKLPKKLPRKHFDKWSSFENSERVDNSSWVHLKFGSSHFWVFFDVCLTLSKPMLWKNLTFCILFRYFSFFTILLSSAVNTLSKAYSSPTPSPWASPWKDVYTAGSFVSMANWY